MTSVSWVLRCLPCSLRASSCPHRLSKDFSMWSLQQGYLDLLDDGLRLPRIHGNVYRILKLKFTWALWYFCCTLLIKATDRTRSESREGDDTGVWLPGGVVHCVTKVQHVPSFMTSAKRLLLNPCTHPSLPKMCLLYSSGSFSWVSPIFLGSLSVIPFHFSLLRFHCTSKDICTSSLLFS